MIVINPEATEHTITVIPRYYPTDAVTVSVYNEATQQTISLDNTYEIVDGQMFVSFEFEVSENVNYQIAILEDSEVVYRDKIFTTSQVPQEYKLTNNVYYS